MARPLRITAVNAAFDPSVADPDALLAAYDTLTGWSRALAGAGAEVSVVQRFGQAARLVRDGVGYEFIADAEPPLLPPGSASPAVVAAVARSSPDVAHVNGLVFPALVRALRAAVGPRVALVAQDHAGASPPSGPGPIAMWRRRRWRRGLAAADAVSFTAEDQAAPWMAAGVLGRHRVLALLESSTFVRATPRAAAREAVGLHGDPLLLWVGRLVENKDPLTVLAGFAAICHDLPEARLAMVYRDGVLAQGVADRVRASATLCSRVTLVGAVPHARIGDYYGAAHMFVSGSRSEGSGYALIEAMACGLVPVVTDIPSFRAIAGTQGQLWAPGDAHACAQAIRHVASGDLAAGGASVRARFERDLSWRAIGERTLAAYRALADAAAGGAA